MIISLEHRHEVKRWQINEGKNVHSDRKRILEFPFSFNYNFGTVAYSILGKLGPDLWLPNNPLGFCN